MQPATSSGTRRRANRQLCYTTPVPALNTQFCKFFLNPSIFRSFYLNSLRSEDTSWNKTNFEMIGHQEIEKYSGPLGFCSFFSTLQRPQIWFQPQKFLNGHTPKLSHAYSVTCRDYLFSKFQNWSAPPGISTAGEHVSTIFVPFLFHLKNFFVPFSEMIDKITIWGAGMVPQVTGSNSFFGNFFLRCSPNWPIS